MNWRREFGIFLLCSVLVCLAVFRGAFWGSRILAPLDIAPTIFSKYRYIDPAAGNVPANHYIIDQLTFDLPLQYTIYHAYRSGEISWWDPYTYAGRPFLADAHVNGTDPIRILCYLVLPFVSAYNWNLILKSILTGLAMFALLRHLRFSTSISLPLALTYQFAGCFAIFFGHPWIQASFAYYPFLWITWSKGIQRNSVRDMGIGAFLCALVFYSGNLQSHAYLPLFALCFWLGNGFADRKSAFQLFLAISLSILVGAAMAAPVLWPQIEFYCNNINPLHSSWSPVAGFLSLSAIFPWALGTFRTLDLSKVFGLTGLGFVLFTGSATFLLACIGTASDAPGSSGRKQARFVAIGLVAAYFVICSTPLLKFLYPRMAPIAVMALIVLAAFGLTAIEERSFRKLAWAIIAGAVIIVLALNLAAFVIYPRYVDRVRALVTARDKANPSFAETPALRTLQVNNLPREISVENPETLLAFVSLIAFALFLRKERPKNFAQGILLTINFLPLILFFNRYIPNQPVEYWGRLKAGLPEQRRIADTLNPDHLRLLEEAPSFNDRLFPNNMGHLQQVHTVHGYSALEPPSLGHWPTAVARSREAIADFVYSSKERGAPTGDLARVTNDHISRVRCDHREVRITAETMTTLTVAIGPGPVDQLLRTDTFYSGWQAALDGQPIPLERDGNKPFSLINLPASETSSIVIYKYRPSHFILTISLSSIACIFVLGSLGSHRVRQRNSRDV
jgi:hypothetical protein